MNALNINPTLYDNIVFILNTFNIVDRSFFVGGMVRDHLLNKESNDIDIVVSNITERELSILYDNLKLTGEDFPVFRFIASDDKQVEHEIELAVARTERSTGVGHCDFKVNFGEHISIEDDLSRRDLTINAMAIPVANLEELVDPFGGQIDLISKVLRHVSPAFAEDPLRVFRAARFNARFNEFNIAPETINLMIKLSTATENLSGERVLIEVVKMFKNSDKPSVFFRTLKQTNNLTVWFPELLNMIDVPQPQQWHGDNDVFDHTLETIDNAATFTNDPFILMGALFHDIGKTLTPAHILPAHHNHENNGVNLVENLSKRLHFSNPMKKVVTDSIKNHMRINRTLEMRPKKVLSMVHGLQRNNTLDDVIAVSHADRMRDGGLDLDVVRQVHLASFVLREKLPIEVINRLDGKNGQQCNQIVNAHRVHKFKECAR